MMRSLEALLTPVRKATENDKLHWDFDSKFPPDTGLSVDVGERYNVKVWTWIDEDTGEPGYSAALFQAGKEIDRVAGDRYSPHYSDLSNLFQVATRSARNVTEIIEDFESELRKLQAEMQ